MNTKLFEIRDSGTMIPVMATLIWPALTNADVSPQEEYLMRRAGYGVGRCVILCRLECSGCDRNATYDPYAWGGGARTYPVAHSYIIDNWDKLESGEVIDVEFILGETTTKKVSEALSYPL